MRLVSQDGMIDVPYEYGSLSIAGGKCENFEIAVIKYRNVSSPNGTKLAEYKSKEKALKVMEMLRNVYTGLPVILQNVYVSEDVKEMFRGLKKNGLILRTDDFEKKQGIEYVNNVVFQFPKDEEVDLTG